MMIGRIFFPAAAAVILLFGAGCSSVGDAAKRDSERFCQISGKLDAGGVYYQIRNPEYLFELLGKISRKLDVSLAQSRLDAETRDGLICSKALFELLLCCSGMQELRGFGASSVLLEKGNAARRDLFRNRLFLAFDEDAQGFLWKVPGTENRLLKRDLETLPATTVFAAEFTFCPEAVSAAIEKSEVLKKELDAVASGLNVSTGELLKEISGEWALLLTAPEDFQFDEPGELRLTLLMPDREKRVFGCLKNFASLLPGGKTEGDAIIFDGTEEVLPGVAPRILWSEGQLILFSGKAAQEEFTGEYPALAETAEFQRLMRGLPLEGTGFCYTSSRFWQMLENLAETMLLPDTFSFSMEAEFPSQLTVLRCEPEGLLAVGNGNWEFNQMEFAGEILLPLLFWAQAEFAGTGEAEESPEAAAANDAACNALCLEQLQKLKKALDSYAAAHGGKFPAGEDVAGLRELLTENPAERDAMICPGAEADEPAESAEAFSFDNASYVYFGGFSQADNGKLPLLADWPFNHPERVNLLLIDGTVESVWGEDIANCKRIIGFLQARYKYNEADFRKLIRQADKLDKIFELD